MSLKPIKPTIKTKQFDWVDFQILSGSNTKREVVCAMNEVIDFLFLIEFLWLLLNIIRQSKKNLILPIMRRANHNIKDSNGMKKRTLIF